MSNYDLVEKNAFILEWSEIQNCFHIQSMDYYRNNYNDQYMTVAIAGRDKINQFIDSLGDYHKSNYTFVEMMNKWVMFCKNNKIGDWKK